MKRFCAILTVCVLVLMATGCAKDIPTVSAVEQQFQDYRSDIQLIVDYMINSGYKHIYITDGSGTLTADFNEVSIVDTNTQATICRLLEPELYRSFSKRRNTICFSQYISPQGVGWGIAYTINGTDLPDVEFAVELIPLSENGWYYYIEDYESWRAGVRPSYNQ